MKFTFLFLNLAKIQIFIYGGVGGSTGLGIIPKKQFYYCFPYFDDKRNTYFSEQKMEVKQDANKDDISSCLMTKYQ